MIHWVQDFTRVSDPPNIGDLDEASFMSAIRVAAQRSTICKKRAKDTISVSSKAYPRCRDALQIYIEQFKDMLELTENDIPDLE